MDLFLNLPTDLLGEVGKHLSWDDLMSIIWVEEFHPLLRALGKRQILAKAEAHDPRVVGRWYIAGMSKRRYTFHDRDFGAVRLDLVEMAEMNMINSLLGWSLLYDPNTVTN